MIKEFLRNTVGITGKYLPPLTRSLDKSLTVFVFHDVSNEPAHFTRENDVTVSTELFKTQLRFISENFNVVSTESWLKGNTRKRAAIITFDDGFQGIFSNALPILREMNLPSVIFMNMGPVLTGNYWAERVIYLCQKVKTFQQFLVNHGIAPVEAVQYAHLECTQEIVDLYEQEQGTSYMHELHGYIEPYASLDDLEEADGDPLVTLGSHLYTHFNVKNLSDAVLKEEYQKNAVALSRFKRYVPLFAFPFGQPGACFSINQAGLLSKSGAIRLFTAWPRPNPDHSAKIIDRVALSAKHDCERRIWFQVLKYPIIEALGGSGPVYSRLSEYVEN